MGLRRTPAEQLADLETKKRQLGERIVALSARAKERQRKDDDRRRVLLGSVVLADLATNQELAAYIRTRLPDVMRDGDRQLFADLLGDNSS